ncbi:hypothetical protein [Flavobacterium aquiphilum]|uniref:hypothetical protein n=1 Tax=Flavobacterium aquiphilum TaxID=3003261 RepID=UPI0024816AE9|nr:hypothetical protein [Flavobacterium aquiphilum]
MKSRDVTSVNHLGPCRENRKSNFGKVGEKVFLIFSLIFCVTLFMEMKTSQKKVSIPSIVSESFQKEFPNQKVLWTREDDFYEAEFRHNGIRTSVVYGKMGNRKEFEVEIIVNELPLTSLDYLKKNYPSNKILETARIKDYKNKLT